MDSKTLEQIAGDLAVVKKFMVIDLIARGFSQDEVGKLMDADQSKISKMFPGGILKKAKTLNKAP